MGDGTSTTVLFREDGYLKLSGSRKRPEGRTTCIYLQHMCRTGTQDKSARNGRSLFSTVFIKPSGASWAGQKGLKNPAKQVLYSQAPKNCRRNKNSPPLSLPPPTTSQGCVLGWALPGGVPGVGYDSSAVGGAHFFFWLLGWGSCLSPSLPLQLYLPVCECGLYFAVSCLQVSPNKSRTDEHAPGTAAALELAGEAAPPTGGRTPPPCEHRHTASLDRIEVCPLAFS